MNQECYKSLRHVLSGSRKSEDVVESCKTYSIHEKKQIVGNSTPVIFEQQY
jgi:hypothetical protein